MSDDEVGEFIVEMFDKAAAIADRAPISAHLLEVWSAHVNKRRRADVPEEVVEREFFKGISNLEMRVIRIERALERSDIDLGDMPPLL